MNENVKYTIKDNSIIHCKSKEEAEWFFNKVNDTISMKHFEIYDSRWDISYNKHFIFTLFDIPPSFENYFYGLYFHYTNCPLKVVLLYIGEKNRPDNVLEASDLMKQEEIK